MEQKREQNGEMPTGANATGHTSAFFPATGADKQDKSQLAFLLQTFNPDGKTSSSKTLATREELNKALFCTNSDRKEFVICWPLCVGHHLYMQPALFEKTIRGIKARLKGKALHFILIDTGELHRHNMAKQGVSPALSPSTSDGLLNSGKNAAAEENISNSPPDDKHGSNFLKIPVTKQSQRTKDRGIEAGKKMRDALNTAHMGKKLGVKFSFISWEDIQNPRSFRKLFLDILGISAQEPTWFKNHADKNDIHDLANFVEAQYEANDKDELTDPPNFTMATSSILTEQAAKDCQELGIRYNLERSLKYNKAYLWEETAKVMLMLFSAGDLIDVMMQPATLPKRHSTPRRRSLFVGEVLNEWVFKLLSQKLDIDFTKIGGLYQYVTVGMYPEYHDKSAHQNASQDTQTVTFSTSPKESEKLIPRDNQAANQTHSLTSEPNKSSPSSQSHSQKAIADIYSSGKKLEELPAEDQELIQFLLQRELTRLAALQSKATAEIIAVKDGQPSSDSDSEKKSGVIY